jgi:hypothetical protein
MQASAPEVLLLLRVVPLLVLLVMMVVTQLESLILAQNERWRHA